MRISKPLQIVFILIFIAVAAFGFSTIGDDDDNLQIDFAQILIEIPFDQLVELQFLNSKNIFSIPEYDSLPKESNLLFLEMHETSPPVICRSV